MKAKITFSKCISCCLLERGMQCETSKRPTAVLARFIRSSAEDA